MTTIRHYGAITEVAACTAFLEWQGERVEVVEDVSILANTRGVAGCVMDRNGRSIAVGAFQLFEYWQAEGMVNQ